MRAKSAGSVSWTRGPSRSPRRGSPPPRGRPPPPPPPPAASGSNRSASISSTGSEASRSRSASTTQVAATRTPTDSSARRRRRGSPSRRPRARPCQKLPSGGDFIVMQAKPSESRIYRGKPDGAALAHAHEVLRARPGRRSGGRLDLRGERPRPAPEAQRRDLPQAPAGRRLRVDRGRHLGRAWTGSPTARAAPSSACWASTRSTSATARRSRPRMRAAVEGEYDAGRPLEGSPVPYAQMLADLDSLVATIQRPHLRELLGRLIGPDGASEAPGGQVLPPGLPPRAARALPVGGPGRERAGREVPRASTATSPSPARCCTTSARSRPTARSTARSS